jgi:hypothetical protein
MNALLCRATLSDAEDLVLKEHVMKETLVIAGGLVLVSGLLSDARRFALAERRWQREHSLPALLHLATSGLFLAGDVARLW